MIVPIDPPAEDDEWEPIDALRLYHAAHDLHRAAVLHDHNGTLVAVVPHDAWVRLGAILNVLPVRDRRPAAQRKRATAARANRT